jgi:hypothetical protein
MATVRYESDAELLASTSAPPTEYDSGAIRRIRAAVAQGRRIILGEVGQLALWAVGGSMPDECLAVADYSPGNPHPMWSQVRRWAREAGVLVPGLMDAIAEPALTNAVRSIKGTTIP